MTKRKLAYFSPLPPTPSGISDYSWELLPFLADSAEITLFHNEPSQLPQNNYSTQPIAAFAETHWQYDLPIYHIGNSDWHNEIYTSLRKYPGITVLHDFITYYAGDLALHERNIYYETDSAPVGQIPPNRALFTPTKNPLTRRLLTLSLGLIVHSQHVAGLVQKTHPNLPIQVVPMPIVQQAPPPTPRDTGRRIRFGSIGQITPARQLKLALRAFGRIQQSYPNSEYHIIGAIPYGDSETTKADLMSPLSAETRTAIHWHGHIDSLSDFETLTRSLDLLINLRHPSAGETSASALRALGQGVPVIVFDDAWYSELPDSCTLKIPLLDEDALLAAMQNGIIQHTHLAASAWQYIATRHNPRLSSDAYISLVEQVIQSYW